jgi:hypothetical protein
MDKSIMIRVRLSEQDKYRLEELAEKLDPERGNKSEVIRYLIFEKWQSIQPAQEQTK